MEHFHLRQSVTRNLDIDDLLRMLWRWEWIKELEHFCLSKAWPETWSFMICWGCFEDANELERIRQKYKEGAFVGNPWQKSGPLCIAPLWDAILLKVSVGLALTLSYAEPTNTIKYLPLIFNQRRKCHPFSLQENYKSFFLYVKDTYG